MSKRVSQIKIALAALVASTIMAGAAHAQQSDFTSVTASIRFDTPLTVTKNNDISFGAYATPSSSKVYTISTAGVVSGSGAASYLYGLQQAGSVTVAGSPSQTISITASGYTTDTGVVPSAAMCKYGTATETACTSPISVAAPTTTGTTLLLGVTLTANGSSQVAATTYSPSFTVTAVYN